MTKLGGDAMTVNFFGLVAENGRLRKLEAIVKSFNAIMSAHRGEVPCTIVSAKDLDAATAKQLEGVLQSFVQKGQTLHITKTAPFPFSPSFRQGQRAVDLEVDPSIMGGLIINIGDKYVDMSLATKFRRFESVISQAV